MKGSTRFFFRLSQPILKNEDYITSKYRHLKSEYKTPKYPLVLCHGFSGFDKLTLFAKPQLAFDQAILAAEQLKKSSEEKRREKEHNQAQLLISLSYWRGIQEALENLGSTVFIAKVPAFGDIKSRAISLDKFITKQCKILRESESKKSIYNDEKHKNEADPRTFKQKNQPIKINLISHSMGGLDCRYLISKVHRKDEIYRIVSLTTISTPHHGSEVADFIVDQVRQNSVLEQICPRSIYELTTKKMKEFNKDVVDDPNVKYFSFGAKFNPRWYNLFNVTWLIMKHEIEKNASKKALKEDKTRANNCIDKNKLIDNDGLVSVESSKWGQYIGTLDNVDHLDLINWTNQARLEFDKLMWAQDPPFNPIALYLDIADKLAHRGL